MISPATRTSGTKRWEIIKTIPKSTWDSSHIRHSHTDVTNAGTPIPVSLNLASLLAIPTCALKYDITNIRMFCQSKGRQLNISRIRSTGRTTGGGFRVEKICISGPRLTVSLNRFLSVSRGSESLTNQCFTSHDLYLVLNRRLGLWQRMELTSKKQR